MRDLINIINEAFEQEMIGPLAEVQAVLKRQFWHMVDDVDGTGVWQHMDDPALGQYLIYRRGDAVTQIEYHYPPMPAMDRSFDSVEEFAHHVDEITEDEVNHVGRMKGAAKLAGIAHDLRQKRDGEA